VFTMWMRELNAPREKPAGAGGAASATRVRIHGDRPRPKPRRGGPRRVNQTARPAPNAQHVHYVPHEQDWAGRPTGRRGGAVPGNEEVGGVRTQGRT
jgi:hypothetical protein